MNSSLVDFFSENYYLVGPDPCFDNNAVPMSINFVLILQLEKIISFVIEKILHMVKWKLRFKSFSAYEVS